MTIKLKTVLVIISSFFIFALIILYFSNRNYQRNIEFISSEAIDNARISFKNLQVNDTKMLSSTLEGLLVDDSIRNTFSKRDRKKLLELTSPLFTKLHEKYSITHFYFIDPPPSSKCFLRVHTPEIFDDEIKRATYISSIKSGTFGSGLELGKTAFALRVVHPVYNSGKLIGYMELGEEIEHFLQTMKSQTNDEFGFIVAKDKIDKNEYLTMRKNNNLTDNWDEMKDVIITGKTMKDDTLLNINIDLSAIPDKGMILGNLKQGKNMFIKGLFPVIDANSEKVGAIFVLHDISNDYNMMKKTQIAIIMIVVIMSIFISVLLIILLNNLIFSRLHSMNEAAIRVVGGDYDFPIKVHNDDEIGEFESLFEQFRVVFVDTIKQISSKK
ncbi:MAG: cache domain-containing protein [bacterium]|nr:cache domain-containing protein [bacterium]